MILAVDTATRWTGLAIHDGRNVLAELGWQAMQTQTVELAPAVVDLLRRTGLQPGDLAAVAVAIGPGSYTGLRIGLGFAKGLALANGTRLIGISTLDILAAAQAHFNGLLVTAVGAGRSRICAGRYQWQGNKGWQPADEPDIYTWETLLASQDEPALFTGEVSLAAAKLIRATGKSHKIASPAATLRRAGYLAELGWQRLRRGWVDDPAKLAPIYLRDPAGSRP